MRARRSPFSVTWACSPLISLENSARSPLISARSSVRRLSVVCCWFQMMANTPSTTATS